MSVFFYGCITMDGYLADKNHNLDWLYQTGTIEETGCWFCLKLLLLTILKTKIKATRMIKEIIL